MPFQRTTKYDQLHKLIGDYLSDQYTVVDLHRMYGVSCKTIYKWINRYKEDPANWALARSSAPHSHPNQTPPEILEMIINMKLAHLSWGPRKIIHALQNQDSTIDWPAASTAGEWLKRHGLVKHRLVRSHVPPYSQPFGECNCSNAIWSIDYKGQFRLLNGEYCYPLTITDNFSRFLLCCHALPSTNHKDCEHWLDWTFQQYGLPDSIRSDNGVPFCIASKTGLSRFWLHLIRLGITLERIEKGKPQQNGRHERMHRTLKHETCKPPARDMLSQQEAFNAFIEEYNTIRPHEALGGHPPASVYQPSLRKYPLKIFGPEYPEDFEKRKIKDTGEVKLHGKRVFVSELLAGEYVALEELEDRDGIWRIYYYQTPITDLDIRTMKLIPIKTSLGEARNSPSSRHAGMRENTGQETIKV